jgi:hypothetical protein
MRILQINQVNMKMAQESSLEDAVVKWHVQ